MSGGDTKRDRVADQRAAELDLREAALAAREAALAGREAALSGREEPWPSAWMPHTKSWLPLTSERPYTKAREKYFPSEDPAPLRTWRVLEAIRDLLATRGGRV